MRYRIGEAPETSGSPGVEAGGDAALFAVLLGLMIGIACTYLGRHGKQMWLQVWGAGLVLLSIGYIVYLTIF